MLFNSTHSAGAYPLPAGLQDVYVRYKVGTRAIVAWLIKHSNRKHDCRESVCIRDLLDIVESFRLKPISMPEAIDFYFRETIAARKHLTSYFRKQPCSDGKHVDDCNHEYFTDSLNQIYEELCKCCQRPKDDCKQPTKEPILKPAKPIANKFVLLEGAPANQEGEDEYGLKSEGQCQPCAKRLQSAHTTIAKAPRLVDDDLGTAFELCAELQHFITSLHTSNKIWEEAAEGRIPLVLAAFVTNSAYAACEDVEQRVKQLCQSEAPEALWQELRALSETSNPGQNHLHSQYLSTSTTEPLKQIYKELLSCKTTQCNREASLNFAVPTPKTQIILRRSSEETESTTDHECLRVLLNDIGRHIALTHSATSVVRLGTPLFADIGCFLKHTEGTSNGIRCAFGVQLLLETYKSYIFASENPHPGFCRLQALRFAQEAIPCIHSILEDATMPCRCEQTLAFHLQNLQTDYEAFMAAKVFDLYIQSSWVSGCHILEMLDSCFYYGLRLFSYRNLVGSLMHIYHVLRSFTGLESIPILEEIRNTFDGTLFPGGRPKRNFRGCYTRYMGGKLKFKKHNHNHSSGQHHMIIPSHAAQFTAGFGLRIEANDTRFQYQKISLFHHIKERGNILNQDLRKRVDKLARPQIPTTGSDTDHEAAHHKSHSLYALRTALLPSFAGPLPLAKVNLFKVYLDSVRCLRLVSSKIHDNDEPGNICLCFVNHVLDAADRFKDNEHRTQPFGLKELVRHIEKSMREVFGGRGCEEFVWKDV